MKTYQPTAKNDDMNIRKLTTCISIVICLLTMISVGCTDDKSNIKSSIAIDSLSVSKNNYLSILEQYKSVPLTNDTILYGFRIGMTASEIEGHLKEIIKQGRIVNKNHKLFGLIPTNEYCSSDKDSVHQFVTELVFHLDKQNQTLTGIYASLYAPRFYIRTSGQRKSETELMKNPLYKMLKKSNRDSATADNDEGAVKQERYADKVDRLMYPLLLENYKIKYGNEAAKFNEVNGTNHIWIDNGRLIKVNLCNDLIDVANKFLYRKSAPSKEKYSDLILIGEIEYSSVKAAIEFETEVDETSRRFQTQIDSSHKRQEMTQQEQAKERVRKSGI